MATGDNADMLRRLYSLLPPSWFKNGPSPVLNSVLSGFAAPLSWAYSLYAYALLQYRIGTSTGGWLDLAAFDYFGIRFPRRTSEVDALFAARIEVELIRPRQTRAAITTALVNLTGRAPLIVEPFNPNDRFAWGAGPKAYWRVGRYGSLLLNNQIFITAYRSLGAGITNKPGWNYSYYGVMPYVSQSEVVGPVTDADIYAAIADTIAAGYTAWVQILNDPTPIGSIPSLDFSKASNSQNIPMMM